MSPNQVSKLIWLHREERGNESLRPRWKWDANDPVWTQWSLIFITLKQSNKERHRGIGTGEDEGGEHRHGRWMEHLGAQSGYGSRKKQRKRLTRGKKLQILNTQKAGLQQVPKTKSKWETEQSSLEGSVNVSRVCPVNLGCRRAKHLPVYGAQYIWLCLFNLEPVLAPILPSEVWDKDVHSWAFPLSCLWKLNKSEAWFSISISGPRGNHSVATIVKWRGEHKS